MKIVVVGAGYVGLVAGVCFADAGHDVTCVDIDANKIALLKDRKIPIYEPGLEDLMAHCMARLTFTTDLAEASKNNDIFFIAVGTPEQHDGSADLQATLNAVETICRNAQRKINVILKSTVPIGTASDLNQLVKKWTNQPVEIINNPEFLKEGSAIDDFLRPDRVVVGCTSTSAADLMREIYNPFVRNGHPILIMSNASAEMTKYAANAFLSVKISFINELASLADKMGADIDEVRKGFTSDSRINPAFFYPGVGYGGSCFPKDVRALSHIAQKHHLSMSVVDAADSTNDRQKLILFEKAKNHFGELRGLCFGLWGLSFKPKTDDMREAPSLHLMEALVNAGAKVKAYDPIAGPNAKKISSRPFELVQSKEAAITGADGLMLVTEWNEFRSPDLPAIGQKMKQRVIFDGRNVFEPAKVRGAGFEYYCVGRESVGKV